MNPNIEPVIESHLVVSRLPSFIFIPVPLLPACVQRVRSGCRMYWSEHLLETFLLSPVSMFSCAVVGEGGELAQWLSLSTELNGPVVYPQRHTAHALPSCTGPWFSRSCPIKLSSIEEDRTFTSKLSLKPLDQLFLFDIFLIYTIFQKHFQRNFIQQCRIKLVGSWK